MIGNFQSKRSLWAAVLATAVAGFFVCPGGPLTAQEVKDFRQFTDKQGRALEARPVSVTPDRKNLKIQLRDGKEVDLEIVLLSLDDQQYLREWVATQPATASNFRLQVTVEKVSAKPSDRRRANSYRLNTEHVAYRVRVTNLSRETLPAPVVEYHLVKEEGVRIYRDEDRGDWDFSSGGARSGVTEAVGQTTELPDLVYNRQHEITTSPVEIDQVLEDGSFVYGQDKLIGAIVQIRDGAGNVVGTWRSSDPGIGKLEWEDVLEVAGRANDPDGPGGPGGRRRFSAAQGDTLPADAMDASRRNLTVKAEILPDALAPDGVIASHGGSSGGWALVVKGGRVIFSARPGTRAAKSISAPLPAGTAPVAISAVLSEGTLEMVINDLPAVSGDSPGLLSESPSEPLSVGFETGDPVTSDYEAPFKFAGVISDFSVRLGPKRPTPGQ